MPPSSRSPLTTVASAIALLLPIAFSTSVYTGFWSPKVPLVLLLGAIGLPRVALLARSGPHARAARSGLALGAVAIAAALFSAERVLSLLGLYNWGTGAIWVLALIGAWGVGVSIEPEQRASVELALLCGVGVNIAAAFAGRFLDFYVLRIDPNGRAQGFLGNPGPFGIVVVLGLCLAARRFGVRPLAWAAAIFAAGTALELSGSRGPLVVGFVAVLCFAASRGWSWLLRIAAPALFVAGLVVAGMLPSISGASGAAGRLAAGEAAGGKARLLTWRSGIDAVADRPLLGAGPGRFRAATSKYRTAELARAEGPDRLFVDAHNIVVEYAVTVGGVGLAMFFAFIWFAARGAARVALLAPGMGLLLHLVEPQAVGSTPLVFLLLGMAAATAASPIAPADAAGPEQQTPTAGEVAATPRAGASILATTTALVVIAAVASAVLLLGDFHREQARLDYNFAHAEAASRLLAPWPEPLDTEARVHLLKAIVTNDDPAEVQRSRQIREDAIRRAPTDPSLWNEAGELDAAFGFHASAAKNFSGALRHNPWSLRALVGLARAQLALGQPAQAVAPLRKALQLTNSPTVKRLLATAESRAKP